MVMFCDLQEQVAFNLMQFSLFFKKNSEMVYFYDSGRIFMACKFHGHIASFKFAVNLWGFFSSFFSLLLAVINHFKMHCLLGHTPHCSHLSRNRTP